MSPDAICACAVRTWLDGNCLRVESIAVDGDTIDEQLRVATRLRYRQSVPEGCARWTQQIRNVKYSRGPDFPSCEECKGNY